MIKKLLFIIVIVCFLTSLSIAGDSTPVLIRDVCISGHCIDDESEPEDQLLAWNPMTTGGQTVADVADDCSGDLMFSQHFEDNSDPSDVTVGSPAGCSDGDETGDWGETPTFSSAYGQEGTGTLAFCTDALRERLGYTLSGSDLANLDDFKLEWNMYVISYGDGYMSAIEINDAGDTDLIRVRFDTGGTLRVRHKAQNNAYISVTNTAVDLTDWISCIYESSDGIAGTDAYLDCWGATAVDADAAIQTDHDFVASGGDGSGYVYMGDANGTNAGSWCIDDVKISLSDRWD